MIIADAKIYPGIIIYLYNAPYQILRNFILHYKDCADFVPIHSLEKDAKTENADVKTKFFEFLAESITYRDGKFNLKGIKYYNSMSEFVTERSMHLVQDPTNEDEENESPTKDNGEQKPMGRARAIYVHNKTYKTFKTLEQGKPYRMYFTRQEIDVFLRKQYMKKGFDHDGKKFIWFTDDYKKMIIKNNSMASHVTHDGRKKWNLETWLKTQGVTDPCYRIEYCTKN